MSTKPDPVSEVMALHEAAIEARDAYLLLKRLSKEARPNELRALVDASAALEAKVRELEKDAARYRWLRQRPSLVGWDWWPVVVRQEALISPEFMDAAIDSARETSGRAGGTP